MTFLFAVAWLGLGMTTALPSRSRRDIRGEAFGQSEATP